MRILLILLWLVFCVAVILGIIYKFSLKKYGKIGMLCVCLVLFLFGANFINLNVVSSSIQEKVNQVTDVCGDTYIRTHGSEVQILVNGDWLNLSDISVLGDLMTDELTITYDGEEIYLGESGVVNTIKVMESVGLLEKK
jgi:hypothetical protein